MSRRPLRTLPLGELEGLGNELRTRLQDFRRLGLGLDLTRGKPSARQLDLASDMLTVVGPGDTDSAGGVDCRNYGGVEGLPEARALLAPLLDLEPDEVLVGGNASLALLHDVLAQCLLCGAVGGSGPWSRGPVKVLCPVPGYDRHFSICERFGLDMVPVPMTDDGPDVETAARLARDDETVRAMICVPKYSNPTGVTYSDEVVRALASMKTRAPDFRLLCDNAYSVHDLEEPGDRLLSILGVCREAGNEDRPILFGSTSKISFAGAGVTVMGGSPATVEWLRRYRSIQTIGPDKLNQLRHVRFFGDFDGIVAHMKRHATIMRPKFEATTSGLEAALGGFEAATWNRPRGGYFLCLHTEPGCAARVVELAAEVGVKLTPAGAPFPYGHDPEDRVLRLAPSFATLEEVRKATEILAHCVLLAAVERRLGGTVKPEVAQSER